MVSSLAVNTHLLQLPRRRTRTALDADDHAHNLSQWEQSYDQFSGGSFKGQLTELWLPQLQLFQESANQVLHQSCSAWADSLWFGLPSPHHAVARLDAQPILEDTLLFRPGGCQFELSTPENYDLFGIVISQHLLQNNLLPEDSQTIALLQQGGMLKIPPILYRQLLQTLNQALFASSLPNTDPPGDSWQESIVDLLCTALTQGTPPQNDVHYSRIRHNRKIVHQARELVLSQTNQRLSIAEICRQLHISRRALQYSFQAVVGLSPLTYLRTLKLNQVRRRLHDSQDLPCRVTQVATTWGFEHLGQFSQAYRELFGETPSATLRK